MMTQNQARLTNSANPSSDRVVDLIRRHHTTAGYGSSRLLVLAMYAIVSILVRETGRYRGCAVLPPQRRNRPVDLRSNAIGDVNVVYANGRLLEFYDIKRNQPINAKLIQDAHERALVKPAERFYILTTYPHQDYAEYGPDIHRIWRVSGRQLVVDDFDRTLSHYLRLIGSTRQFIDEYATSLENDPSVPFRLKEAWSEIVSE